MRCLRPFVTSAAILLMGLGMSGVAAVQSKPQLLASTEAASARSVQVISAPDGPAVEVLTSRPVVPAISKIDNPSRLVIDLPNTRLVWNKNRIDFRSDEVHGVRVNQFQNAPPVTRIVVDLTGPVTYSWDAAGNRLMVRLRSSQERTAKPLSVSALTQGVQPVAVPLSAGGNGAVLLAGSKVSPGSSVTAGADTAILRLGRGGEVRVCPGTTVSVTSSQNGHALMLGMSTGAMEAHYYLDASADSILTPDFRIQLPGPGEFHYAVSADTHGNTCVRALPGNTASVIVAELMGDGTYQVKPSEQVVFHSGRLNSVDAVIPAGCGCPPPTIPVMRASATPEALPANKMPSSTNLATSPQSQSAPVPGAEPARIAALTPVTAPLPPSKANDVHVQVEAPFVFRADEPPPPEPAPVREAKILPLRSLQPMKLETVALPPDKSQPKPAHHGVFGKIRGFFASLFSS